ncbi:MAG: HPr kinase/phosphorylase, partial [Firmicutes bacterium]|nr:HPr kinase/phosphorylase [Bacillota bacterium]
GAVLHDKQIDLVLHLEEWNSKKEYNRLGSDKEVCNILGLELPLHTIPVRSGRNMSIILEVAARNYRLKSLGYDALSELNARVFDE